jgi:hypothetical protein
MSSPAARKSSSRASWASKRLDAKLISAWFLVRLASVTSREEPPPSAYSDKTFNFELGLTPYVTPLFGVADSENHRGVVVGGLLDVLFKFDTGK